MTLWSSTQFKWYFGLHFADEEMQVATASYRDCGKPHTNDLINQWKSEYRIQTHTEKLKHTVYCHCIKIPSRLSSAQLLSRICCHVSCVPHFIVCFICVYSEDTTHNWSWTKLCCCCWTSRQMYIPLYPSPDILFFNFYIYRKILLHKMSYPSRMSTNCTHSHADRDYFGWHLWIIYKYSL